MTRDTRSEAQQKSFAAWNGSRQLHVAVCLILLRDLLQAENVTSFEAYWDPDGEEYGTFETITVHCGTEEEETNSCINHYSRELETALFLRTDGITGPTLLAHTSIDAPEPIPAGYAAFRVDVSTMLGFTKDDVAGWQGAISDFLQRLPAAHLWRGNVQSPALEQ